MPWSPWKDKPSRLALVDAGCPHEALVLRQGVELFGSWEVGVDLLAVGAGSHLARCLRGQGSRAEHLVICCHGDAEKGILLPDLAPQCAAGEQYLGSFGAEAIRREARLSGRVVLATGCATGLLAEAFLAAGAAAYLAPRGEPSGAAPLGFLMTFYYRLLAVGDDLETAFRAAQRTGGDCRLFGLFRP